MSHPLPQLRDALLELHKTLVDSERISYEQTIGSVSSPNHFLQLLVSDPWFAWLHPISLLVVTIDQAMDSKRKLLTDAEAEALIKQTRELLVASEKGEGFPKHYYDALQRDPSVVMAHAKVAKYFAIRKSGK